MAYNDVLKLEIVVDITTLVHQLDSFDLKWVNMLEVPTNYIVIIYTVVFENYFEGHCFNRFRRFGPWASINSSACSGLSLQLIKFGNPEKSRFG